MTKDSINIKAGCIYISGGGNFDKTQVLDRDFINRVRDCGNSKVLFVPIAKETDLNGYKSTLSWLKDKIVLLGGGDLDIEMVIDVKDNIVLENYGAVYLGGGNTYRLQKFLHSTNISKKILAYYASGGIIYGASAGAAVMGTSIAIYKEEDLDNYEYENGLSCIDRYSFRCHYGKSDKAGDDKKIFDFIDRNKKPVIALPEGSAIFLCAKYRKVIGGCEIFIFNENKKVSMLNLGDYF